MRAVAASARLAACPAIMITPSATYSGSGKARFAADSAMSALYLMNSKNSVPSTSCASPRSCSPPVTNTVASIERTTATLVGQTWADSQ